MYEMRYTYKWCIYECNLPECLEGPEAMPRTNELKKLDVFKITEKTSVCEHWS